MLETGSNSRLLRILRVRGFYGVRNVVRRVEGCTIRRRRRFREILEGFGRGEARITEGLRIRRGGRRLETRGRISEGRGGGYTKGILNIGAIRGIPIKADVKITELVGRGTRRELVNLRSV